MEYKMDTGLVIFDLDGTLLNTIGDLAVACNAVLAMRGLPQHTYDEYCHFVATASCGSWSGVARRAPHALYGRGRARGFREILYRAYRRLYETLRRNSGAGCGDRAARCSYRRGIQQVPGRNGKTDPVVFPRCRIRRGLRPARGRAAQARPRGGGEILALTGVAKEPVLYVGDSGVDMQTAAAAGVRSVGVTWGFRERAELEEAGARHIVDSRPGYWSCYSPGGSLFARLSGSF